MIFRPTGDDDYFFGIRREMFYEIFSDRLSCYDHRVGNGMRKRDHDRKPMRIPALEILGEYHGFVDHEPWRGPKNLQQENIPRDNIRKAIKKNQHMRWLELEELIIRP